MKMQHVLLVAVGVGAFIYLYHEYEKSVNKAQQEYLAKTNSTTTGANTTTGIAMTCGRMTTTGATMTTGANTTTGA